MNRIFASPSKYIQGPNALTTGIPYIKKIGKHALLICDEFVWRIIGEAFLKQLVQSGIEANAIFFKGEASREEILRMRLNSKDQHHDVVIGLGGGKTIDAAKAVSNDLNLPVVIIPTTASTDAPTSAISVIYTADGYFEKYILYDKNPELVLMDTQIIANAPAHFLASGIADALATWVEARSVLEGNGTNLYGGLPTLSALAIAKECERILFKYGLAAFKDNQEHQVTPALEAVVEANTLLSGIGFESGGLAAAHAIHNGFSALYGQSQQLSHGEKVAYGTLTQLFLENKPKTMINPFITFYQALGLPTTLAELKTPNISYEDLLKVGKLATKESETIHQMAANYSAEDVTNALFAVDAYVQSLK